MEDHVDRAAEMGARVLINDGWYNIRSAVAGASRPLKKPLALLAVA